MEQLIICQYKKQNGKINVLRIYSANVFEIRGMSVENGGI